MSVRRRWWNGTEREDSSLGPCNCCVLALRGEVHGEADAGHAQAKENCGGADLESRMQFSETFAVRSESESSQ